MARKKEIVSKRGRPTQEVKEMVAVILDINKAHLFRTNDVSFNGNGCGITYYIIQLHLLIHHAGRVQ